MRQLILGTVVLCACSPAPTTVTGFPSVERTGDFIVLRLEGTPYEMGWQHGVLLREELLEGADWISSSVFAVMEPLAETYGLLDEARANSYPEVIAECQGLVDAIADDDAWTLDRCLALAYGDVIVEVLEKELYGCSQFVASGEATVDGSVLHGRNLDWDELSFILEHPTLIVRRPVGAIPWVAFGFPGNVSPYNGINDAGLSGASNEAHGTAWPDGQGRPHTQMLREVLQVATSVEEARAFLEAEDHISAEVLVFADAGGAGAAFEMAVDGMATRTDEDRVVWATNHFVAPEMAALGEEPDALASTRSRLLRLEELLAPGGAESRWGSLDVAGAVDILRDTHNPLTGETVPVDQFDGGGTLANNAAMQSLVFSPDRRALWIASGPVPVPQNPYTGFDLDWLLGRRATPEVDPAQVAAP